MAAKSKNRKQSNFQQLNRPRNAKKTLLRILPYIGKEKYLFITVLVMIAINSVLSITASYLLKPIIDDCILPNVGADNPNWKPLIHTLSTLAIVYLFSVISSYGQSAIMMVVASKAANRLRADLFNKLQDLPLSYFDGHTNGEIMSRFINDADNVEIGIEQTATSRISAFITFVGTVYMMIRLNYILFLLTAVFIVLTAIISWKMTTKSRVLFRRQQQALGVVNAYVEEMVTGIRVVKAFNYEEHVKREFAGKSGAYRDAAKAANFLGMSQMPTMNQLIEICYALTTVIGGFFVLGSEGIGGTIFTVGSLSVFLNYTRQIRMPIRNVTNQFVTMMSALAGAERIFNVMDQEPEVDNGTITLVQTESGPAWNMPDGTQSPLRGEISLKHVSFSYEPGKQVIRDMNLTIRPGEKVAFVGSTGAGKSTVMNLINRFYDVQEGTVTYDGIDIKEITKDSLRRSMGVVLQDTHLFTGTIMENIRYGRLEASDSECIEAAKSANAFEFIDSLPQGFNTVITADGSDLSQGQRQLLNISRAMLARRPVLVLDEATSSIDTRTEQMVDAGMNNLMAGRTVLVIAHRLSTVRNADRIAVIEGGQIIELGSHRELLALKGHYYQLYTGQHALD